MSRPRSVVPFVSLVIALGLASGLDYNGCAEGDTRLCFGFPSGCVDTQTCVVLFKAFYDKSNNQLNGELSGTNTTNGHYMAVALSLDNKMGDDSTTECTQFQDGTVALRNGFNHPRPALGNELRDIAGIQVVSAGLDKGVLRCTWTRAEETSTDGFDWNLKNPFFLLISTGEVDSDGTKKYHGPKNHAHSPHSYNLEAK